MNGGKLALLLRPKNQKAFKIGYFSLMLYFCNLNALVKKMAFLLAFFIYLLVIFK
tara:strand:+ start:245 stop:409 length:165 start_codon:yes stop_codon:yes gene_type:complete